MMETARLIKEHGHSAAHVFAAHPELPCSERTFCRYVGLELRDMKKHLDLIARCPLPVEEKTAGEQILCPRGASLYTVL